MARFASINNLFGAFGDYPLRWYVRRKSACDYLFSSDHWVFQCYSIKITNVRILALKIQPTMIGERKMQQKNSLIWYGILCEKKTVHFSILFFTPGFSVFFSSFCWFCFLSSALVRLCRCFNFNLIKYDWRLLKTSDQTVVHVHLKRFSTHYLIIIFVFNRMTPLSFHRSFRSSGLTNTQRCSAKR